MLKRILIPLSSLRLTIVLMALALVLVYAGTWAQVDTDVFEVQKQYFHSVFTWVDFQTLLPRPKEGEWRIPGGFPMPGGYTLGLLMLANLTAAAIRRFRVNWKDLLLIPAVAVSFAAVWLVPAEGVYPMLGFLALAGLAPVLVAIWVHGKRSGIILIHTGLVLLLLGEGATSWLQVDAQMMIPEGSSADYAEDSRQIELAVVDPGPGDHDKVTVVPGSRLITGRVIEDAALPFTVKVDEFFVNSSIVEARDMNAARATRGVGRGFQVVRQRKVGGAEGKSNVPAAYVTLSKDGQPLGTWLVSPRVNGAQVVRVGEKTYHVQLRAKRYYKPYTIHLIDFAFDRWPGTNTPRNYSSRVRLVDPSRHVDREVLIWMNHPLRHGGETFYQSSFTPDEKATVLQVVRNPSWLTPYIACVIGTWGLMIHFGLYLREFVRNSAGRREQLVGGDALTPALSRREREKSGSAGASPSLAYSLPGRSRWSVVVPVGVGVLCVLYLVGVLVRPASKGAYDLGAFGRLPVMSDGRVQPLDSLARNSLSVISGRSVLYTDAGKVPAIQWLLDVFTTPAKAENERIFRIDHPDIIGLLKLDPDQKGHRYSMAQIKPQIEELAHQHQLAEETEARERDRFQVKVLELGNKWMLFQRLLNCAELFLAAPMEPGQQWRPLTQAAETAKAAGKLDPSVAAFEAITAGYQKGDPATFNAAVSAYQKMLAMNLAGPVGKAGFEAFFNRAEPFIQGMYLYVLVFLLVVFSWLLGWQPLRSAAFAALIVTLVFHTLGLAARVYISGRPPVTNLYSSAIFIAWGAVILAAGFEWFYRNGIGSVAAAVIGFLSLLIGHNLIDGDTMRQLQAVLDTNFWLATHVVTIALGYAATFLVGIIGIVYIIRGILTQTLDRDESRKLARMIYGVLCFAILFSFVGTILGGIWADQSWGRFWGWDPKENGAVLIVLWNALVLHTRWAGLVRDRGLAVMAIGGNIITAWSWFGTNMLGVGLHSYGFMDSALFWLLMFVVSQLVLMGIGLIPMHLWRSQPLGPTAAPEAILEAGKSR